MFAEIRLWSGPTVRPGPTACQDLLLKPLNLVKLERMDDSFQLLGSLGSMHNQGHIFIGAENAQILNVMYIHTYSLLYVCTYYNYPYICRTPIGLTKYVR